MEIKDEKVVKRAESIFEAANKEYEKSGLTILEYVVHYFAMRELEHEERMAAARVHLDEIEKNMKKYST